MRPIVPMLILLTLGTAAAAGSVVVPDAAFDEAITHEYKLNGQPLALQPFDHDPFLSCNAKHVDVLEVGFAVTPDGMLEGSLSIADIEAELRCGVPNTTAELGDDVAPDAYIRTHSSMLYRPGYRIDFSSYVYFGTEGGRLTSQTGNNDTLCHEHERWREGDTLRFRVPIEGTANGCFSPYRPNTYSFHGTFVPSGSASAEGTKLVTSQSGAQLRWTYQARDNIFDPAQPLTFP